MNVVQDNVPLGAPVDVVASVANTGEGDGSADVLLKVNGMLVEREHLVLSAGESEDVWLSLVPTEPGAHALVVEAGGASATGTVHVQTEPAAAFHVTALRAEPARAHVGGRVQVSASVGNSGDLRGAASVQLLVGGSPHGAARDVALAPGESRRVTLEFTPQAAGDVALSVTASGASGGPITLTVDALPAKLELRDLRVEPGSVPAGKAATVTARVANAGEGPGTATVRLIVDGEPRGQKTLDVAPGKTSEASFRVVLSTVGEHRVRVALDGGGERSATLRVEPPPPPPPIARFSGSGSKVTAAFTVDGPLALLDMTHGGRGNFIVWILDARSGEMVELPANVIGKYDGSRYASLAFGSGRYVLEVTADGPWSVTVRDPPTGGARSTPADLGGKGDAALPPVRLDAGLVRVAASHSGSGNFIVWLYDEDGYAVDLLVNEIGRWNGEGAVGIPASGRYYFDVQADGGWSLDVG